MNLTIQQAYLAAFYFLDAIYDESKNESLGNFLSSMSPNTFVGCISADPATWLDWENCTKSITRADSLTFDQAFQAMISFLKFNKDEFEYDFSWLLNELQESDKDEKWLSCVKQTLNN